MAKVGFFTVVSAQIRIDISLMHCLRDIMMITLTDTTSNTITDRNWCYFELAHGGIGTVCKIRNYYLCPPLSLVLCSVVCLRYSDTD